MSIDTTTAAGHAIADYYRAILQREPDEGGFNAFLSAANSGMPLAAIEQAIVSSAEAQTYVDPIIRNYQAAFGRVPDKGGLDNYVDNFARGSMSLHDVADNFTTQPEFTNLYGSGSAITSEYIQATSRVGRGLPGLVFALLEAARPRDVSHIEHFAHY